MVSIDLNAQCVVVSALFSILKRAETGLLSWARNLASKPTEMLEASERLNLKSCLVAVNDFSVPGAKRARCASLRDGTI